MKLIQGYLYKQTTKIVRQYKIHFLACLIGYIGGYTTIILLKYSGSETALYRNQIFSPISDVGDSSPNIDPNLVVTRTIADHLHQKVRILCFVSTAPKYHQARAYHIKATWGKRCNILLFMSSKPDDLLPTVVLPMADDQHMYLWQKTKDSLKYIYRHYYDKVDWFLKADDDTYVIMENLRYFLHTANTSEAVYYGCRFSLGFLGIEKDFMSGGAGYVLSKEALRRFVEVGLRSRDICSPHRLGMEDVEMGICLQGLNVKLGDVRDLEGRGRFFPAIYDLHVMPKERQNRSWFFKSYYYQLEPGMRCCSDTAISFHYATPTQIYALDYLVYRLRPFGMAYNPVLLNV